MGKSIITWVVVLAAMAAIAGGLGHYKYREIQAAIAAGTSQPEPVEAVDTAKVRRELWAPTTRAIGTVVARKQLLLKNEIAGLVVERGFDSGAVVAEGQLLIQIDDRQERAALEAVEAEAELAKSNLARRQALKNSPAFSEQEFDKASSEFAAVSARAQNLKVAIEKKRIIAPFKARVGITDLQPGAYLDVGTSIVRLQGVDDDVYIDFSLPQENAALLKPGEEVAVMGPAVPGGTQKVTILAEDDSVDSANRTVRFRAKGAGLGPMMRPGAFVDVVARTADPQSRIVVPLAAVRRSPNGQHVFAVVEEDRTRRARQRPIVTGAIIGTSIIVESGISEGETVATSGSFKLRDGMKLAPEAPGAADGAAAVN